MPPRRVGQGCYVHWLLYQFSIGDLWWELTVCVCVLFDNSRNSPLTNRINQKFENNNNSLDDTQKYESHYREGKQTRAPIENQLPLCTLHVMP